MGLYDTIIVEQGVTLPHFPESLDQTELNWKTKTIGNPSMQKYNLTNDGCLLRLEKEYRDKTEKERHEEATKHGFNSWDEYTTAVRDAKISEQIDNDWPVPIPDERVIENEIWLNHNQHGSFTMYAGSPDESKFDITWRYEAQFNRGQLESLLLLGDSTNGYGPDEIINIVTTKR